MQICAPLTRSHCKVSDTQVTVRPVGLLFWDIPGMIICGSLVSAGIIDGRKQRVGWGGAKPTKRFCIQILMLI